MLTWSDPICVRLQGGCLGNTRMEVIAMESTIDIRLITFPDLQAARYSSAHVDGRALADRTVFARTRAANYAKFQAVMVGSCLQISGLTVYDPSGVILLSAAPFTVRSSFGADIEHGTEVGPADGDFSWHGISAGVNELVPTLGTSYALFVDFDAISLAEVLKAHYTAQPVDASALTHQIIFARTRQYCAKAVVEAKGDHLSVKRLVVWDAKHKQVMNRSNLQLRSQAMLRLGTGSVGRARDGFVWTQDAAGRWCLSPVNGAAISFPSYYRFDKYRSLLGEQDIQAALCFCRPGGSAHPNLSYEYWEDELKLQCEEYLYLLDTGRPLPITGPPATTLNAAIQTPMIDWKDGRKVYFAHVAQSLWVEANQLVPWRLSRDPVHLEYLFDSRKLMTRAANEYYFDNGTMGLVTAWNPQAAYAFFQRRQFIANDEFSTVKNFTDWCRSNLVHITDYRSDPNGPGPDGQRFATLWDQYEWYYGYRGYPPVELVLEPPAGKPHITHGCWGTSGLFAGVLRSVNIPVRHGRTNFATGVHSRPEFISVEQNLAHGDDPYNRLIGRGHHTPPIELIFYSSAKLAAEIDNPVPLPGKTVAETASVNQTKKFGAIAVQYKTDYLLGCRCWDLQHNAPSPTVTYSRLWQALHEAYSDAELVQIAAECDVEIAVLGGCSEIPPI